MRLGCVAAMICGPALRAAAIPAAAAGMVCPTASSPAVSRVRAHGKKDTAQAAPTKARASARDCHQLLVNLGLLPFLGHAQDPVRCAGQHLLEAGKFLRMRKRPLIPLRYLDDLVLCEGLSWLIA